MRLREKGWLKNTPIRSTTDWQLPDNDDWSGVELQWAMGRDIEPEVEKAFREYVETYKEAE